MPGDAALLKALESSRKALLDLTARNRLLNTPRATTRSSRIDLVDESSAHVFEHLVAGGKAMTFLAGKESSPDEDETDQPVTNQPVTNQPVTNQPVTPAAAGVRDEAEGQPGEEFTASERPDAELAPTSALAQPDEEPAADQDRRPRDDKLQTRITSVNLQKRLLKLYYDARAFEEEQGVNTLYLALGFLKWYEEDKTDRPRYAPLLLIPVQLERPSASSRFRIRYTEEDIATNLSLRERLKFDFRIELPEVPAAEDLVPEEYFAAVTAAVARQPRWEVLPDDMVLWFFSFSKFLMYHDLEPASWPEAEPLGERNLVRSILQEGFESQPPICGDDDPIDGLIPPAEMIHVLDADSSQALVVEEVRRGRNLVIQGPPGTGKSQTIANLIAAAVRSGQRVLFVAEKMAALEVVERRLNSLGLGDLILELHSHKAKKRAVLEELDRTLQLGRPHTDRIQQNCEDLAAVRQRINRYLQIIHTPHGPAGLTPFKVLGELVRLRAARVRTPDFRLGQPLDWTGEEFRARFRRLADLAQHAERVGVPQGNAWNGVELESVLPTDVDRIAARVGPLVERIDRLGAAAAELAAALGLTPPADLRSIETLATLTGRLTTAPLLDRSGLAESVWVTRRAQIESLLATGNAFDEAYRRLEPILFEAAWDVDVAVARKDMAAEGRSWLRWLNRNYRAAKATLRGLLRESPPQSLGDRLAIFDTIIAAQKAREQLRTPESSALGRLAFGPYWNGENSDWRSINTLAAWEKEAARGIPVESRGLLARDPGAAAVPLAERVAAQLPPLSADLKDLLGLLRMNFKEGFGVEELKSVPLAELSRRLPQWQQDPAALSHWVNYAARRRALQDSGLEELVGEIHRGDTAPADAVGRGELAYYEELIRDAFRRFPELATFDGTSHERLLERFRQLDRQRIDLARQEVAAAHWERLPKSSAEMGEVGLVRREIAKKRRHLPIRQLLAQAGRAVQAIKPVFMMSPISVAQYLEPGGIEFDLLLIDEASQVEPVDALGAAARARQFVVVGDSRQLPPTRFFSRMLEDEALDADETSVTSDTESILGLCCAQNMPQRMLRWHYRSRHHSLIAVSNREFYDNRLYVIPSPEAAGENEGLVFRHVADGVFDRGGTATNRVEAKVAAEAVILHARTSAGRSLGVGAFSVAQRDAILDELEVLRRAHPELESFFLPGGPEPFFVKNLENIQGDERDEIFISVGYARDSSGNLSMNFGPLSNDGGERRLNVLITRARICCRVFSSIRSDDIDTGRARSQGAQALKTFLHYAESGLLDGTASTSREPNSQFERQVAEALAGLGYKTDAQVGVAGFFIDLAVVDPDEPGHYLLGIECDGRNYREARSARDRDRIREAVLRDRGWKLHRIWSVDFLHRPDDELRKLREAIEEAKAAGAAGREGSGGFVGREGPRIRGQGPGEAVAWQTTAEMGKGKAGDRVQEIRVHEARAAGSERSDGPGESAMAQAAASATPGILRHAAEEAESLAESLAVPYEVAAFRVSKKAITNIPARELANAAERVIAIEGPIHRDELARRLTQLWNVERTGKRVREAVDEAIEYVARLPGVRVDEPFLTLASQTGAPIRDRRDVESTTLRRPEVLPPAEIRAAVTALVRNQLSLSEEEAVSGAARVLGFKTTTPQLREVIVAEVRRMVEAGTLMQRNGSLALAE